jgi:hypothetical protein
MGDVGPLGALAFLSGVQPGGVGHSPGEPRR